MHQLTQRRWFVSSVLLLFIASGVSAIFAADDEQPPGERPDPAALAELFKDYLSLAPEHEGIKKMAGEWNVDAKYYWDNPTEPKQTKASSTFKLILDGRFLQQDFQDTIDGQRFAGMGISGYDKMKKEFVGVWMDNMTTGMMVMEGEANEDGHIVEYGESTSPMGKMKFKMVTKPVTDDKFVFTMYTLLPDGKEQMGMELTYTRK